MTEQSMVSFGIMGAITAVAVLLASLQQRMNSRFKARRARRSARRIAEYQRVQENRYQTMAGGRATGRTFAGMTAAAAQLQGMTTTSTTSTTQQSIVNQVLYDQMAADPMFQRPREPQMAAQQRERLSQRDLMDAYTALGDQPLAPQQSQEVAIEQLRAVVEEQKKVNELKELKAGLAEPFWAWHDRREHETKRVGTNDSATSSTDIRVQRGPRANGDFPDAMALSLRAGRMVSQGQNWQNAITTRVDQA